MMQIYLFFLHVDIDLKSPIINKMLVSLSKLLKVLGLYNQTSKTTNKGAQTKQNNFLKRLFQKP